MKLLTLTSGALLTTLVASSGWAEENTKTVCSYGSDTRIIEVVYPEKTAVPCEVRYTKAEGTEVLWNAQNAIGYCEQKAAEFIQKQEGWGWSCKAETPAKAE